MTRHRSASGDILLLRDGEFTAPVDVLTHTGGEAARQQAIARWGRPQVATDVNCFLLRREDGLTLIDAGTGDSWGPAFGGARAALAAAGVAPAAVARVLLTHLHGDHALGLFDASGAAFPAAEIWVPEAEMAFFTDPAARAATPEARRGGFAIAERLGQAYAGRLHRFAPGPLLPGLQALALPGHTPGHTGYLLDDALLVWGDTLHLQALQPAEPAIGLVFDLDPAQAAATRRDTLARAAAAGWVVAGSHVAGFHRVVAAGAGFRLDPA